MCSVVVKPKVKILNAKTEEKPKETHRIHAVVVMPRIDAN